MTIDFIFSATWNCLVDIIDQNNWP